ncbi:MAG: hypothetical protein KJ065_22345 [Anaerolineae bacterium]|nr:hypothetical protein [Anaerolineae bacterium]
MAPDHDPLHDAYYLLASSRVPRKQPEGQLRPPPYDPNDPRFVRRVRRLPHKAALIPAILITRIFAQFFL